MNMWQNDINVDEVSDWSDEPGENESETRPDIQSRAYQIEMFERSLQQNIIVTMDTGSGKTQIARLRIEAEMKRSPDKRVWFCAPSVVLATQQYEFLSSTLRNFQVRLITGLDNAQFWSTQSIWDAVLENINIIVSTPQVLLDGLSHSFLLLKDFSLLVFDEAHHCTAKSPMAKIMQTFYHPLKEAGDPSVLPRIFGMTASPITGFASRLKVLEGNMDAVCSAPTRQLEEYRRHVHLPQIERIIYTEVPLQTPPFLQQLACVVQLLKIRDDPAARWLEAKGTLAATAKLEKMYRQGYTPVMKQMKSFLGHAEELNSSVGSWACATYVHACLTRLRAAAIANEFVVVNLAERELSYMLQKLQSVTALLRHDAKVSPSAKDLAPKSAAVINYLSQRYRPGISAIIFVKRRSTAYALTEVLRALPSMESFHVFSFVGATSPANRGLMDLANMQVQQTAFADFRKGKQNVCIATPVMEEGIDVQAISLVIRFDEPDSFRSFVQSRGRARQPDSKLVMVHAHDDMTNKLSGWSRLEEEMKVQYADLERELAARQSIEDADEDCDDTYRVSSSGAILTYDNARSHLQHFCTTLPRTDPGHAEEAITLISVCAGEYAAQVRLPSSVAPFLQVTDSLRTWQSEKSAAKDAAFQCYVKLHRNGLVNDNLLPFPTSVAENEEKQAGNSTYNVHGALNPWHHLISEEAAMTTLSAMRLSVRSEVYNVPDLLCLLPQAVDHQMVFPLQGTLFGDISIELKPQLLQIDVPIPLAMSITRMLLTMTLGRRLKKANLVHLPYLLLPDMHASDAEEWYSQLTASPTPLHSLLAKGTPHQDAYLVRKLNEEVPYCWAATNVMLSSQPLPDSINATRLTKQLSFLSGGMTAARDERVLLVEDCVVEHLPVVYAQLLTLLPSIQHMLEITLRGQAAVHQGPLRNIGYSDSRLVVEAFTAPSASAELNYERLEFLGDAILKWYSTAHVFFEYPLLPEGDLSRKRRQIVSNARLQRATRSLKLDTYVNIDNFAGLRWTMPSPSKSCPPRTMSSKTLADVVEALLAAAFLDCAHNTGSNDLVIKALLLLLPETNWRPHVNLASRYTRLNAESGVDARIHEVENMLGYQFRYKPLLTEALTRTTLQASVQSYDRLEFLGDAVLDFLVSQALFHSKVKHDPESMTRMRIALVNGQFLSLLAMNTSTETSVQNIVTTPTGETTMTSDVKTVRLIDHVTILASVRRVEQRDKAEKSYQRYRQTVHTLLEDSRTYPWVALHSIEAPKMYGDIIEAIVGAVYVDSCGNLLACKKVLQTIGHWKVLEILLEAPSMELRPPIVVLKEEYPLVEITRNTNKLNKWKCTVLLKDRKLSTYISRVSQSHADNVAGSLALKDLASTKRKHASSM